MDDNQLIIKEAPGHPGYAPHWTSSKKDGIGRSISRGSLVWYTISEGIINEVYYPRIDSANIRDFQFLITDKSGLFEEEKKDCEHEISMMEPGVPIYQIKNTSHQKRFIIEKTILTDPGKDALLIKVKFIPLKGKLDDYQMYAILNPHMKNYGYNNNSWVGDYKGVQMLYAQREDIVLALACSTPFVNLSCGFYGTSDGWQEIKKEKKLSNCYSRASNGNVTLTANWRGSLYLCTSSD